jgi:hypothetical protein
LFSLETRLPLQALALSISGLIKVGLLELFIQHQVAPFKGGEVKNVFLGCRP